jgi:tetratricopeptide (TPR) repeat protein
LRNDQSRAYWAYDFGRDFLDGLKKDAVVFAEGDFFVMPIYYLQHVEGRRPDVLHLTSIFLSLPWGVEEVQHNHPEAGLDLDPKKIPPSGPLFTASIKRLKERNQGKRPLYASMFHEVLKEFYAQGEGALTPSSLALEYSAPGNREQERRILGLAKALRGRHWEAGLENIHPSTQFMLSNYASAYLELANHLRGQGKAALASPNPYYRAAILLAPRQNRSEALTHWGMALAEQGKPEEALKAFQDSAAIKPLFEAYSNMAGVYNNLKKYDQAVSAARKAVELAPNSPEALNNLAIAIYYTGDKKGAVAILEKAAALNPANASVINNLKALKGN